jgi:signal transduction histidine kinase
MIRVETTRDGTDVTVRITDNGIGLEKENFESIFEMFGQVDRTSKRENAGLGIGLALVKHLVEDHGGTVKATSEGTGLGTTMHIHLPLIKHGTQAGMNGSGMTQVAAPSRT